MEAELQEEGVELVKESNCSDQAEIRTEVPVNQNGVSSAEAEVSEGEERFRARFSKGDDLECQLKTQGDLPPGDRSEAPVKDSDMGTAPAVGQQ